jgi:hypothetical protein
MQAVNLLTYVRCPPLNIKIRNLAWYTKVLWVLLQPKFNGWVLSSLWRFQMRLFVLALLALVLSLGVAQPVLVIPYSSTGGLSNEALGVSVAEALTSVNLPSRVLLAAITVRANTYSDTLERERSLLAGQVEREDYTHILLVASAREQRLANVTVFGQTRIAVRLSVTFALLDRQAKLLERFDLSENGQGSTVPEAVRQATSAISAAVSTRTRAKLATP